MIGALLNERYRLDAEIGRGGMGTVYRARDTLLERNVAVKVLSEASLGTKGHARLLHEAQAAAQLHHPNVVTVHDVGEAESATFIVMELVEGASLKERRRQGQLEAARHLLSEARQKTAEGGNRLWDQCWLPVAEAHIAAVADEWPAAWAAFQAAVGGFAQAGLHWDRVRTLAEWAEAHLARSDAGDRARAQELLHEAAAEFATMGAPAYAARMQARLADLEPSAEP